MNQTFAALHVTASASYVQSKEMNSARADEGRLPRSSEEPFPGRAAFQQAVAAGKPCGQEYAGSKAGADGLRYFPTQTPTNILCPGVLSCFIISFKPSTLIKQIHTEGLLCFSTRKLAKSKQQVTEK